MPHHLLRLGGALTCAAAVVAPLGLVATPALAAPVTTATAATTVEDAPVATSTDVVPEAGVDADALTRLREAGDPAARPAVLTGEVATGTDFDVLGVTWSAADTSAGAVTVAVRVLEDGAWSTWETLPVEDAGPDAGSAEARSAAPVVGTSPLATDGARAYQLRVDTTSGAAPQDLQVRVVDGGDGDVARVDRAVGPEAAAAAAEVRGSTVAASAGTTAGTLSATSEGSAGPLSATASTAAQPTIVTRAQWGADESLARSTGRNDTVKAMVVHHTASSNSYSTASQSMSQLRGIYAYHTQSLGWSDIGYNFVVDKFGTIYEGRRGSITEKVMGAHAAGFNTDTMGVSAMGNYEEAAPSSALVRSIAAVAAWKLGEFGVSPTATTTLTSAGGGTARYSKGRSVTLPTVLRHMDVGYTACPGSGLSAQMESIRTRAAQLQAAAPTPAPVSPAPVPAGAQTLVGDWNGDGVDQPGLFVDGAVSLRRADGSTLRYRYGQAGDVAVVGDWDGDGRDTVSVFRKGRWLIKDSNSGGAADRGFWLGQAGDVPVAGSWDGRRQGVGVYRDGRWMLRKAVSAGPISVSLNWGRPSDRPVVGDWDGDGADTPGLQRGAQRFRLDSLYAASPAPVTFGRSTMAGFAGDLRGTGHDGWGARQGATFFFRTDTRGGVAQASVAVVR